VARQVVADVDLLRRVFATWRGDAESETVDVPAHSDVARAAAEVARRLSPDGDADEGGGGGGGGGGNSANGSGGGFLAHHEVEAVAEEDEADSTAGPAEGRAAALQAPAAPGAPSWPDGARSGRRASRLGAPSSLVSGVARAIGSGSVSGGGGSGGAGPARRTSSTAAMLDRLMQRPGAGVLGAAFGAAGGSGSSGAAPGGGRAASAVLAQQLSARSPASPLEAAAIAELQAAVAAEQQQHQRRQHRQHHHHQQQHQQRGGSATSDGPPALGSPVSGEGGAGWHGVEPSPPSSCGGAPGAASSDGGGVAGLGASVPVAHVRPRLLQTCEPAMCPGLCSWCRAAHDVVLACMCAR
jgi:hypothetical protein